MLAPTDSQSDVEASSTGGEVLDLTSREKDQPWSEGAPEPSQVNEELPVEELTQGAAEPTDGEERGAEESPEPEGKHSAEDRDEDADGPEEDTVSNKSLDLNLASKLMGFKLAEGGSGAVGSGGPAPQDQKHTCSTCGKSFKFLGTLSRHRKAHGREVPREESALPREGQGASGGTEGSMPVPAAVAPAPEPEEKPEPPAEGEAVSEGTSEKQSEEAEGTSDGEGTAEKKSSEKSDDDKKPKTDTSRSVSSKADKRKKVCTVCNKRFWSLQDLTRHMRSHTGKSRLAPGRPGVLSGQGGVHLFPGLLSRGQFGSVPSLGPTCLEDVPPQKQ